MQQREQQQSSVSQTATKALLGCQQLTGVAAAAAVGAATHLRIEQLEKVLAAVQCDLFLVN